MTIPVLTPIIHAVILLLYAQALHWAMRPGAMALQKAPSTAVAVAYDQPFSLICSLTLEIHPWNTKAQLYHLRICAILTKLIITKEIFVTLT